MHRPAPIVVPVPVTEVRTVIVPSQPQVIVERDPFEASIATSVIATRETVTQTPPLEVPTDLPPPEQLVPTADEFSSLPLADQLRMLSLAVEGLRVDLEQDVNGAGWIDHLKLDMLAGWFQCDDGSSPETLRHLGPIADRFEQISRDDNLKALSSLIGFQVLRVGLRELSLEPRFKTQRAIRILANDLAYEVDNMTTATLWRTYLRLDRLARLDADAATDSLLWDELSVTLDRFERLTTETKYGVICEKPAFVPLRETLTRYLTECRY